MKISCFHKSKKWLIMNSKNHLCTTIFIKINPDLASSKKTTCDEMKWFCFFFCFFCFFVFALRPLFLSFFFLGGFKAALFYLLDYTSLPGISKFGNRKKKFKFKHRSKLVYTSACYFYLFFLKLYENSWQKIWIGA